MLRSRRPGGRRAGRGLSLIEALVALAVMGFGTLAVLGVQTSLRLNGDVARQRGEALVLARQAVQDERAWATADDYLGIATQPDETVEAGNTTFTVRRTVVDAATDENQPRRKLLTVDVTWQDRTGQAQTVSVSTALQAAEPVVAASLVVPARASTTRNPGGRHRAIPRDAFPFGEGRSRFNPGGGASGWVFNNVTGFIERACVGPGLESCAPLDARLLGGFVRFATTDEAPPPTAADAEVLPGTALPVDVVVSTTAAGSIGCAEWSELGAVAYACAVPVDERRRWSGRASVFGREAAGTMPLAESREDARADRFRVCRYTPYRGEHPTVPEGMTNAEHPLDYVAVEGALLNQNFLVIRAGDGTLAYDCPPDGPSPYVNTNTWHHQPASRASPRQPCRRAGRGTDRARSHAAAAGAGAGRTLGRAERPQPPRGLHRRAPRRPGARAGLDPRGWRPARGGRRAARGRRGRRRPPGRHCLGHAGALRPPRPNAAVLRRARRRRHRARRRRRG